MELLAESQVGRRLMQLLGLGKVRTHVQKPVVQALQLIKLRNESNAFNGEFEQVKTKEQYAMQWSNGHDEACLHIELDTLDAQNKINNETHVLYSRLRG